MMLLTQPTDTIITLRSNEGNTVINQHLPQPSSKGTKLVFISNITPTRDAYKKSLTDAGASGDFAELFIDRLSDGGEHESFDT